MSSSPQYLRWQDCRGKWRKLYAAPLTKRETLRANLIELSEYLAQLEDQTQTFIDVYDSDDYFRAIVDETLQAGGIKPEWCSHDMMLTFLLPHTNSRGEINSTGILHSLNFPQSADTAASGSSKPTTYADLLAMLWASVENLEMSLRIADQLPADLLVDILKAKAEIMAEAMLTPEDKYKREQKRKAKEYIQEFGLPTVGELEEVTLDD